MNEFQASAPSCLQHSVMLARTYMPSENLGIVSYKFPEHEACHYEVKPQFACSFQIGIAPMYMAIFS